MSKNPDETLESIGKEIRKVFQSLLKEHVKTAEDRLDLAQKIDCSPGHVQSMLYEGKGGLDTWAKAFAYFYGLNSDTLRAFKRDLRQRKPPSPADRIWMEIKDELKASEDERYYLARCAYEACRIKRDLDKVRKSPRVRD